jgi:hypothetical protein
VARDSTATSIEADLGEFGRVDLLLNRSGHKEGFRLPCGGPKETFEPGVYEGMIDFVGEGGYTRAAAVSPPSPFSGSATAHRNLNSLLLSWQGSLKLAFPGRTVSLAGPSVHVSLVHAHLTRSDSSDVEVGI